MQSPFQRAEQWRSTSSSGRVAVGATCAVLMLAAVGRAETYYVATDGDDDRTCAVASSMNTPKKTINDAVKNCLKSGDTLLIRGGVYAEALNESTTRIPSGTSWSSPVTIAGFPKEKVVMRPKGGADVIRVMGPSGGTHHVIFKNLVLDGALGDKNGNGFRVTYTGSVANTAHHIRLQDSEVMNAKGQGIAGCGVGSEILNNHVHHNGTNDFHHGIYCSSKDLLIDGNDFHHNSGWGICAYKSGGLAGPNIIVRNNLSHDNARTGVRGPGIILAGDSNKAYNNVVWNNKGGIQVTYSNANNLKVFNNTIFANQGYGISVNNAPNTQIINNIIFKNTGVAISAGTGNPGLKVENNLTVDPLFVDAAKLNFHLKIGSPAIDKGADLSKEGVTEDFDGMKRPTGSGFDVGAFEYGAAGTMKRPIAPTDFTVR